MAGEVRAAPFMPRIHAPRAASRSPSAAARVSTALLLRRPWLTHDALLRTLGCLSRGAADAAAVCDLGSTNGTFVNRVKLAANVWRALKRADVVTVGKGSELKWVLEDDTAAASNDFDARARQVEQELGAEGASQLPGSGSGRYRKPKGRPPKGSNGRPKHWDAERGIWFEIDGHSEGPTLMDPDEEGEEEEEALAASGANGTQLSAAAAAAAAIAASVAAATTGGSGEYYTRPRGKWGPLDSHGQRMRWSHSRGVWISTDGTETQASSPAPPMPPPPPPQQREAHQPPFHLPQQAAPHGSSVPGGGVTSADATTAIAAATASAAATAAAAAAGSSDGGMNGAVGMSGAGSMSGPAGMVSVTDGMGLATPLPIANILHAIPSQAGMLTTQSVHNPHLPTAHASYVPSHLAQATQMQPQRQPSIAPQPSAAQMPPSLSAHIPSLQQASSTHMPFTSAQPAAAAIAAASSAAVSAPPSSVGMATPAGMPPLATMPAAMPATMAPNLPSATTVGGVAGVRGAGYAPPVPTAPSAPTLPAPPSALSAPRGPSAPIVLPPGDPAHLTIYGLGLPDCLGFIASDTSGGKLPKDRRQVDLKTIRRLLDRQLGEVLKVLYPRKRAPRAPPARPRTPSHPRALGACTR